MKNTNILVIYFFSISKDGSRDFFFLNWPIRHLNDFQTVKEKLL